MNNKFIPITLLLTLYAHLAGCGQSPEQEITEILKNKSTLVDPSSVMLRNIRMSRNGNNVCGELNSKNRMGGYAGWKQFSIINKDSDSPLIYVQGLSFKNGPATKQQENSILKMMGTLCDI